MAKRTPRKKPTAYKSTSRQVVLCYMRDFSGKPVVTLAAPYNGTAEDAVQVARPLYQRALWEYPDASNINSFIGATDADGSGKWIVSSNFKHVAEVGTPEAAYIAGDVSVYERLKQRQRPQE